MVQHFRDEMYRDVRTPGYNVRGLNVQGHNVRGRIVHVPTRGGSCLCLVHGQGRELLVAVLARPS
jgi:hypothetical protein